MKPQGGGTHQLTIYPWPDRSNQVPITKAGPYQDQDIGWAEGRLKDSRPFRAEVWRGADLGAYHLTILFARRGLEFVDQLPQDQLASILARERLVFFRSDKRYVIVKPWTDPDGNELWWVSIVLGDSNNWFADTTVQLQPY